MGANIRPLLRVPIKYLHKYVIASPWLFFVPTLKRAHWCVAYAMSCPSFLENPVFLQQIDKEIARRRTFHAQSDGGCDLWAEFFWYVYFLLDLLDQLSDLLNVVMIVLGYHLIDIRYGCRDNLATSLYFLHRSWVLSNLVWPCQFLTHRDLRRYCRRRNIVNSLVKTHSLTSDILKTILFNPFER